MCEKVKVTRKSKFGWNWTNCIHSDGTLHEIVSPCHTGTVRQVFEKIIGDKNFAANNSYVKTQWFVKIGKEWKKIPFTQTSHPVSLLDKGDQNSYLYNSITLEIQ